MDMALTLLRTRKLAAGILSARLRRALRLGVAAGIEHRQALARLNPRVVLDVGANKGQFSLIARDMWPEASIIGFEPLATAAAICRKVMGQDPRFRLVEAAVGTRRETRTINLTRDDDSSSLLPVAEAHKAFYDTVVTAQLPVQCGPLPDFVSPDELLGEVLLKIDTQGFELEVLKGSEAMHDRITSIYAELSFVELYAGQPLSSEVIAYLADRGFELSGVFNVSLDGDGRPIQADMLFRRAAS